MESLFCTHFELSDIIVALATPVIFFLGQVYFFKPRIEIRKPIKKNDYFKIPVINKTWFGFKLVEVKASLHIVDNPELVGSSRGITLIQDTPIVIYNNDEFVFKNKGESAIFIQSALDMDKALLFRITLKHPLFGRSIFKQMYFSKKDITID